MRRTKFNGILRQKQIPYYRQKTRPSDGQQKRENKDERTSWIVVFAVSMDHRMRIKENEKIFLES